MHAIREQGRPAPRILYWFRTPPNVRVGRAALDEDAIRLIEETHPDVVFDWKRMLKSVTVAEPAGRRHPRQAKAARPAGARGVERRRVPDADEAEEVQPPEQAALAPAAETLEGTWGRDAEGQPLPPPVRHVLQRVGRSGADTLRARYAELLARITERVTDPVRLEELRVQAERLNPDTWVTDEEAKHGIEGFDAAYAALRSRLGRRRRRRRSGARRRRRQKGTGPPEGSPGAPAEATGAESGKSQV